MPKRWDSFAPQVPGAITDFYGSAAAAQSKERRKAKPVDKIEGTNLHSPFPRHGSRLREASPPGCSRAVLALSNDCDGGDLDHDLG